MKNVFTLLLLLVLGSSLVFAAESGSLSVADWYPQGTDYVFICEENGFVADSYTWTFGDGQQLVDVAHNTVFHSFASHGMYEVTCTASNDDYSSSYTLVVGHDEHTDHACYESLHTIPATCHGGEITYDVMNGCREIHCASDSSSLHVLACEKPNVGEKEYFELYKLSGDGVMICLADTCVGDNGYAKSSHYPLCADDSHDDGHSGGDHHGAIEVPHHVPKPAVDLIVYPDAVKGWNLYLDVENFVFAPQNINLEHAWGEGHGHLYINGEKITRLYGNWYYVPALEHGYNEIRVTLNANTHAEYSVSGEIVEDTEMVHVGHEE